MNDTWKFSLADYKFKKLKDDGEVPYIRNGHTINFYEGKLYVFGGIHDITWELDDLHIYDLKVKLFEFRENFGQHWNKNHQEKYRKRITCLFHKDRIQRKIKLLRKIPVKRKV